MRYAFSRRELQFLNKNIYNNQLHGIPKPTIPFVTMKQKLINHDIISYNENKELKIESVYKSLFDSWRNMEHMIEFKNDTYDLDIVLYNDTHIITIEEDGYTCEIGYFLNEPVGLRNYILNKLNMSWTINFDSTKELFFTLNDSEAKQLFLNNEEILTKLSFKHHVHKNTLKELVSKTSNNAISSTLYITNLKDVVSSEAIICANESGHYLHQRTMACGQVQHIVSICESKKIIESILV